jgi:hypothetical protein
MAKFDTTIPDPAFQVSGYKQICFVGNEVYEVRDITVRQIPLPVRPDFNLGWLGRLCRMLDVRW